MSVSPQALRRRAKKFFLRNPAQLFVQTLPGLEQVAEQELSARGLRAESQHGGLNLSGSLQTVYLANLSLRTANRVLLRLHEYLAQTYPMLYDRAREPDWVAVLGNCPDYWIHVTFAESKLRHAAHIRSVLHDAILSRLQQHGLDPELRPDAEVRLHARVHRDRCTLSLDTTGTHLHKRGYRTKTTEAPIRETIAAALLIAAKSTEFDLVVDPFCGSGTFLIEADYLARRRPPSLFRSLAIEHSPLHAPGLLRHTRRELQKEVKQDPGQRILGFDISAIALQAARSNIDNADVAGIKLAKGNATSLNFSSLLTRGERGLIVANLPYGRRLGTPSSAEALLGAFLSQMARNARGWAFALISPFSLANRHRDIVVDHAWSIENGGRSVACSFGHVKL